jgi:Tfp pilus assembly protein PilF
VKKLLSHLCFVVFLLWYIPATAQQYEWKDVRRIVAVGDVHGAYDNFVAVLKNAGLIDDHLDWIGGETHFVQVGDIVDRGAESRRCLELLMKLEGQAQRAGGLVHPLIGNHEAFNMVGISDYTSPEEFRSYFDPKDEEIREQAFETYYRELVEQAKAAGREPPSGKQTRDEFNKKYPLGYFGHRRAFLPDGRYGKWIASHNIAIRVNGIVFSHGDWSEETSLLGIEHVNEESRKELRGEAPLENGVLFHVKGPLQYRGLSEVPLTRADQAAEEPQVDRILTNLEAKRLVVGHTVTQGIIEPRFGGKHISIDTGMLDIYDGGHQISLEIQDGIFSAIHPEGKIRLPDHLDETNFVAYLAEVASVDPNNVNVHTRLAELYWEQGDIDSARVTLEHLFRIPKPVPFRYHQTLGDVYTKLAMKDEAREQYLLYLDGLKDMIEATPTNPHLKNLYARFCLDRNIALDSAEEMIRSALAKFPDHPSFLLTLGRLQLAKGQNAEAVESLEKSSQQGTPGYETYYYLGLAQLAVGNTEAAREALELALKADPSGEGARQKLEELEVGVGSSN